MSLHSETYYDDPERASISEMGDFEGSEEVPRYVENMNSSNLLLTDDPFSNAMNKELFEAIDKLRRVGANQDIALPQLVIVGKQSAGKSSLLQSLTGIPFPTGGKLCTRFATRIVSRRDKSLEGEVVTASVEDGDVDPFQYPWNRSIPNGFEPRVLKRLTNETFHDAMNEARKAMGIGEDGPNQQHFSSKVFKIEIAGPQQPQFGILDIPGTFSAVTGQISTAEMEGVKKMVTSYMKQKENIIVCVVEADGDLAHQDIFTLAAEHVNKRNLISVFTKCDRAQIPEIIVQSVKTKEAVHDMQLYHGWHVVRNLAPQDPEGTDREMAEHELFRQHPWSEIPVNRRGATMLKKYLNNLLCERIAEAFPGMLATIKKLKNDEKNKLNRLGHPRQSPYAQRAFLMSMVHRYQTFASQALRSPADLESDDIKLRGQVQKANEEFAERLRKHGKTYEFLEINQLFPQPPAAVLFGQAPQSAFAQTNQSGFGQAPQSFFGKAPTSARSERRTVKTRSDTGSDEEENLKSRGSAASGFFTMVTPEATPTKKPKKTSSSKMAPIVNSLYVEIRTQIENNRGEELPGFPNAAVVKPLMRVQSRKWRSIAETYFEQVASLAQHTSKKILKHVCNEAAAGSTRGKLEEVISDKFDASKAKAATALAELCSEYANRIMQTNNPQYTEKIAKSQMDRFKAALERYRSKCLPEEFANIGIAPSFTSGMIYVTDTTITKLYEQIHSSQQKNVEDMVHDLLKAYYEVAQEDFIQHVTQHVIEPFLCDKDGPLFGLSTEFISNLSNEEIGKLGGEDESVVDDRNRAVEKIKRLEAAEEIARETSRKMKAAEVSEP